MSIRAKVFSLGLGIRLRGAAGSSYILRALWKNKCLGRELHRSGIPVASVHAHYSQTWQT